MEMDRRGLGLHENEKYDDDDDDEKKKNMTK